MNPELVVNAVMLQNSIGADKKKSAKVSAKKEFFGFLAIAVIDEGKIKEKIEGEREKPAVKAGIITKQGGAGMN